LGAKEFTLYERSAHDSSFVSELTQGYRYPGGITGAAVALAVLARWPLLLISSAAADGRRGEKDMSLASLADALAPSVGVGAALVRFGCFLGGCCFGMRSSLPWALRFPDHTPPWDAHVAAGWIGYSAHASLPVHPLQLYFIVLSLAAAAIALWMQPRKTYAGQVALVFLAVDGLGKFALELLRHEPLPDVRSASLGIGVVATAVLGVAAIRWRFGGDDRDAHQLAAG
jgi:prolipoprotein diacylglyceryltransferase